MCASCGYHLAFSMRSSRFRNFNLVSPHTCFTYSMIISEFKQSQGRRSQKLWMKNKLIFQTSGSSCLLSLTTPDLSLVYHEKVTTVLNEDKFWDISLLTYIRRFKHNKKKFTRAKLLICSLTVVVENCWKSRRTSLHAEDDSFVVFYRQLHHQWFYFEITKMRENMLINYLA